MNLMDISGHQMDICVLYLYLLKFYLHPHLRTGSSLLALYPLLKDPYRSSKSIIKPDCKYQIIQPERSFFSVWTQYYDSNKHINRDKRISDMTFIRCIVHRDYKRLFKVIYMHTEGRLRLQIRNVGSKDFSHVRILGKRK